MARIFVTGGTGYIGRPTIATLLARGHSLVAVVRAGSERRLPAGCEAILGDPLESRTFEGAVSRGDTFVQLVGTPKPSPAKAAQFERVDLVSVRESVSVARSRHVGHFVYLSVAQPAPVMRAYVDVRMRGEAMIREAGLTATCLRPWYVLGPGHRWAYALKPLYWLWERIPSRREAALRLGLITLDEMVAALVHAIENPPTDGIRVLDVPGLRHAAREQWLARPSGNERSDSRANSGAGAGVSSTSF